MIVKLMDLKDDRSFRLNMNYFNYCTGLTAQDPSLRVGYKTAFELD